MRNVCGLHRGHQSARTVHPRYQKCGSFLFAEANLDRMRTLIQRGIRAGYVIAGGPRTTLRMPNGVANFSKLSPHVVTRTEGLAE
jgi:hypothetical protein